jgi:hypothetical protein
VTRDQEEEQRRLFDAHVDFLNKRINTLEFCIGRQADSLKEEFRSALDAMEKAVGKAEASNDRRFETVNEFRGQLSDQAQTFVRQIEYNARHQSLLERIDDMTSRVVAIDTTVRTHVAQAWSGPALTITSLSALVVIILALIGGAIQMGSLQTRVAIDSDNIASLTFNQKEHQNTEVQILTDIKVIRNRQEINEGRLTKVESSTEGQKK